MSGALKHKERSRYRYHQQKPFVMFARRAYEKQGGTMGAKAQGLFGHLVKTFKRDREKKMLHDQGEE